MVSATTINRVQALIQSNKIFVAAKTHCPYCRATLKTLFEDKKVSKDLATVLQLDTMDDGAEIQQALLEISGQRTVPNIFIGGQHIGGNSDLQALDASGRLDAMLASL